MNGRKLISLIESQQMSPAEQLEDAFWTAYEADEISNKSRVALHQHGPDCVELSHIETNEEFRGQGVGNAIIELLTELADKFQVRLCAAPATDADETNGEDGMGYQDLCDWYARWDFESVSRDRMIREPF